MWNFDILWKSLAHSRTKLHRSSRSAEPGKLFNSPSWLLHIILYKYNLRNFCVRSI